MSRSPLYGECKIESKNDLSRFIPHLLHIKQCNAEYPSLLKPGLLRYYALLHSEGI